MNQKQRKQLSNLTAYLGTIREQLEQICETEQEKLDNLPESLQGSSKEDEFQTAIDALTEAVESIESAIESIESI